MTLKEDNFPVSICGRIFTSDDLALIRKIISLKSAATRQDISREVSLALSWFKPDRGLKDMSCRVALLRLHRAGIIELPDPIHPNRNGCKTFKEIPQAEPPQPIVKTIQELMPIELRRVVKKQKQSYFWNELIERYHYLGYTPLPGAQMRYLVYSPSGCLGALGFSAAAWKVKPRDVWIGWSLLQRERNLSLVVNNSRFLILPFVHSKNLASKILSLSLKKLSSDWSLVYGYEPVLMETFVEKNRFSGCCYKAANWQYVGSTQGRGKSEKYGKLKLPIKDVYLFPLVKNFRSVLLGNSM